MLVIPELIEGTKIIQLFNHLFTNRVNLPEGIEIMGSQDNYKKELLHKIFQDPDFSSTIQTVFPLQVLSLIQSPKTTNAAEVLAFCKVINRYIKNELKVIISSTQSSTTTVDKFIQLKLKNSTSEI